MGLKVSITSMARPHSWDVYSKRLSIEFTFCGYFEKYEMDDDLMTIRIGSYNFSNKKNIEPTVVKLTIQNFSSRIFLFFATLNIFSRNG